VFFNIDVSLSDRRSTGAAAAAAAEAGINRTQKRVILREENSLAPSLEW
jgi:hypothetical protein